MYVGIFIGVALLEYVTVFDRILHFTKRDHIIYLDQWIEGFVIGEQGNSEGFNSCDRPSNLTQMGLKS